MPSPFPGMDPFLEHPAFFPDLHGSLIFCIRESLQARLPEPYYAVLNERLWVETSERYIEPDVDVLRAEGGASQEGPGAGVALAASTRSQPIVITIAHDERRETFVEIRTRTDNGERIVTNIELLSLTNKTPGEKGRELYVQKQQEIVDGKIHLVEIDLLRGGTHSTVVPRRKIARKAGPFDYHVVVHRFDNWVKFFVYTTRLEERLPEIAVPLLPGDPAIPLDLQTVFERYYDAGPYRRRVRYNPSRIVPPLQPDQVPWATDLLREKGCLATE
ncbi:MAG TPA: DUF4058 family protein [Gemmataceae bacterium]|nr:DUF4058 family protein [Gemmataceae bacterium]